MTQSQVKGGRSCSASDARSDARLDVLVISHLYPHGDQSSAGIFVREQVEALSAKADVMVVVGRFETYAKGTPISVGAEGPTVVEVELPWPRWLPSALRVAWLIPRYYREARRVARDSSRAFDVIHAHYGLPDGVVGVMLGRALSLPVVVTLHGSDFSHQIARPGVGRLVGRLLARADRIIGVSAEIVEGMRAAFGLTETQVLHLANGYNDAHIAVHARRTPRYFLFAGALIPRKNPDILLESYALIAPQTGLNLVIVGDGPMMLQLKAQADRLGIASRVRFEGQVEHAAVDGYLSEAGALVLPSSREGMPIIVNEALASGTPVVASDLPGIRQQVRSERLGSLVPVGDIAALGAALLEASRKTWDYGLIARECGVVSWNEYAGTLLDLYRSLRVSRCEDETESVSES